MKYNILSSISLDYCKKELNEIKKISNLNFLLNKKKKIYKKLKDVDIYISGAAIKVDKKFIQSAKKLKAIFSPSTGTDHLNIKELKKKKLKYFI